MVKILDPLGQATEIGSAAIRMICDTWEGHLTPPEAASLADRAARGGDPTMVRVAAGKSKLSFIIFFY